MYGKTQNGGEVLLDCITRWGLGECHRTCGNVDLWPLGVACVRGYGFCPEPQYLD